MNIRDIYIIKRRNKKIRLINIAKSIGCSPSLLSQYETGNCNMDKLKIEKYRNYIDTHQGLIS